SQGGCISFPAGTYSFNSHVSYALSANQVIQLVGNGPDSTILTGSGFEFTYMGAYNAATVRNLAVTTSTASNSNPALYFHPTSGWPQWLTGPETVVEDVMIAGNGNGSWVSGVVASVPHVYFNRLTVSSTTADGVKLAAGASQYLEYHFSDCLITSTQ